MLGWRMMSVLLGVACVIGVAQPSAVADGWPVNPAADPFYAQPAPVPSVPPGTILDSRPVTVRAVAISLPYQAWQVKYRSADTHGRPVADIATIIQPVLPPPPGGRTLVSYQTAEDALTTDCAPSYVLRTGLNLPAEEETMLAALLNTGHTVVTADYEGPRSEWTAGVISGQGVLDGIRAAQNFAPAGLPGLATPTALWGYSGGALATAWANELQPSYAPELRLAGIAVGGTPADLGYVMPRIDGGPFAGVAFGAIAGLARAYPEITTVFTTRGQQMLRSIGDMCILQFTQAYAFQKLGDYTTVPNPFEAPAVKQVLAENTLGHRRPGAPVYLYQAVFDELIMSAQVDTLADDYCRQGVSVQYQRDLVGDHVTEAFSGAPAALLYLNDRLAGKPAPNYC